MATAALRDDLAVADSTDWLGTPLSCLAPLENSLRCQVCKDFFTTPMITSCSHTFCSLCIRRYLTTEGKCPACRAPEQENKLRTNVILETVVEDFKRARPTALENARAPASTSRVKRKAEQGGVGGDLETPRKRTRSSNRVIQKSSERPETVLVDDEREDEDYHPDVGLVRCPACDTKVKLEEINIHLDRCTGQNGSNTPRITTSHTRDHGIPPPIPLPLKTVQKPQLLPRIHYSMLKDTVLRKKLADMGISSTGSKPLLEKRHTEWVNIWNSNCDSSKPRNKAELLKDLEVWERTQGGRAPTAFNNLNSSTAINSKTFDKPSWASKHKSDFADLAAQARRGLQQKRAMSGEVRVEEVGDARIQELSSLHVTEDSEEQIPRDVVTRAGVAIGNISMISDQTESATAEDLYGGSQHHGLVSPSSSQHRDKRPILEDDSRMLGSSQEWVGGRDRSRLSQ